MKPEEVTVALCGPSLVFDRVVGAGGGVPNDKSDVGLCAGEDIDGDTLTGWLAI